MACRGVHFALTDDQRNHLLSLVANGGDVIEFIQEDIEDDWDVDWLCETDKAWDAIHRCLTDGTLSDDDSMPASWCVLNGRQLYDGNDYIVSFVDASDVPRVVESINGYSREDFRDRYDRINECDYGMKRSEEDFEYTWDFFVALRDFYARASDDGRSVLFSVDQ